MQIVVLSIMLSLCFLCVGVGIMLFYKLKAMRQSFFQELQKGLFIDCAEQNPIYYIRHSNEGWCVSKIVFAENKPLLIDIKLFNDEDNGFALREAEELLNNLNN